MWRSEWDSVLSQNYNQPTGLSSRQLAERFGVDLGVVMRRARKLGLTNPIGKRGAAIGRSMPQRRKKLANAPLPPAKFYDGPRLYTGVVPVLPFNDPPTPAKRNRPAEAEAPSVPYSPFKTCQWIDGDVGRDHTMCGAKTVPGYSWCPEHKSRCLITVDAARARGRREVAA